MSSSLLVGGSIAIDRVITPTSEGSRLLGGSGSYAALAASFYSDDTRLVGIVGQDFPAEHLEMLENRGVNLAGIEHSEGNSFSWSGEYLDNMNERVTLRVALNVLENWQVKVPQEISDAPIIVLANMSPDNQLQLLSQCTAKEKFIIADTMDLWISITNERLHELLQEIDLLVINESEAKDLTGEARLVVAGRKLLEKGPRYVVIKLGAFGCMLFSQSEPPFTSENFFRCGAYPLEELVDPTGAGDCFIGALAGYLASTGNSAPNFQDIRIAAAHGIVVSSFACEAFSTQRFDELTAEDVNARFEKLKQMTKW